jgi:predicted PurR-regulated permease PerM
MIQGKKILLYSALFIIATYFLFVGLVYAEPFLVPLLTAMVLAFMMLPITNKFESWKFPKVLATLLSTLILMIIAAVFMAVLFFQIRGFARDWDEMRPRLEQKLMEFTQYLIENTPLQEDYVQSFGIMGMGDDPTQEQQKTNEEQNDEENDDEGIDVTAAQEAGVQAINIVGAVFQFIINVLITYVYVFLFIHFRAKFRIFILRFFTREKRKEVSRIISRSSSVSRAYLAGRLLLMIILTGLYFIGLAISGLENAFFISLIAATLSIIPFVGNFIGYAIAIGVALLTNGETSSLIGITITFLVAQFIDTYILQPIVLGNKVNVHPFFIIISVILGNEIWGIMGMVLAIPIFGIVTVICRNVPALNPFGYLFSNNDLKELDETEND